MKTSHIVAAAVLSTSWLVASSAQAQVTSGQIYRIASACDNSRVMFIKDGSTADGGAVVVDTRNDLKRAQTFKIESANGAYKFTAQHSGKVVDVPSSSKTAGTALIQYSYKGTSNQLFRFVSVGSGYYKIQNVNSGLYMDIKGSNMNYGTPFVQYYSSSGCNQKFKLISTSTSTSTASSSPAPAPAPAPSTSSGARNPFKQPFASNSIWNMPIGSGAAYVRANLSAVPGGDAWAPMPQSDREHIVLRPYDPVTTIKYSNAGWSGRNRCSATGGDLVRVPMPSGYIVPNDKSNSSAVFLMPDKRTLIHTQPLARCSSGGYATSLVKFDAVDLYGDGRYGSHGGSAMSAIGGSIRVGELRPGTTIGPRHALKVNVYAKEALFKCTTKSDCFRWPAYKADSYAVGHYGTRNGNSNRAMKMGALLAIPASTNIGNLGLETVPGKQLAWTLQNYGAYIVDDTWGPAFAFNIEDGPDGSKAVEFKRDYGYEFDQRVNYNNPWRRDIQRLVKALYVVNNNGPSSIGGGGTPRQPLAPAIRP